MTLEWKIRLGIFALAIMMLIVGAMTINVWCLITATILFGGTSMYSFYKASTNEQQPNKR